jgi:uncharacterized protein YkwD
VLLGCLTAINAVIPAAARAPIGNDAFQRVWSRQDGPIAAGMESNRSWSWGPAAISSVLHEPMADSPGGMREVQYFDKSRMEINDPSSDASSEWYVTNGLLPIEMITGKMQVGYDSFEPASPAEVSAIGDPGTTPTYAELQPFYESPGSVSADSFGKPVTTLLFTSGKGGNQLTAYEDDPATILRPGENGHGIPQGFLDFQNSVGTIFQNGQAVRGRVYSPLFVFGLPVTQPYWVYSRVGGQSQPILFQVFERRVLTYNPANSPGFRVEMGNVGQHYYRWRYESPSSNNTRTPTATSGPPDSTFTPTPTATDTSPGSTATPTPSPSITPSPTPDIPPEEQALNRANYYRQQVGVPPMQLHPAIVEAAQNHADYVILNRGVDGAFPNGSHSEAEGFPGFTGESFSERMRAAGYPGSTASEVLHSTSGEPDPIVGIDRWMETVYHRQPFINPGYDETGYGQGYADGRGVEVMNFGRSSDAPSVSSDTIIYYPADNQTELPTGWYCRETPQPFPGVDCRENPVGTVITMKVWGDHTFDTLELQTASGTSVAVHPLFFDSNFRLWYTAPREPLAPYITYTVSVEGTDEDGNPLERTWRFTTGE